MAVRIGSARIDERGKASGGKAGDQTGNEVSRQNWYLHSKGWRVLRPKDPAKAAKMAECMNWACDSPLVGYDQGENTTLYKALEKVDFDLTKLTAAVETDCARLVRVCCRYAGIQASDFYTASEAAALLATGEFVELTDSKYTKQQDYLRLGDVLVTKTKGHTVIVLSDGAKAEDWGHMSSSPTHTLGDRILRNGMEGDDVKELQTQLIQLGYSCGSWGADGDFGDSTELAVCRFQRDHDLTDDGEAGPLTVAALKTALGADVQTGRSVGIAGGQCYVRSAPDKTSGKKLGIVKDGTKLPYGGQQSVDGWLLVEYNNGNGWVSGKYGRLV